MSIQYCYCLAVEQGLLDLKKQATLSLEELNSSGPREIEAAIKMHNSLNDLNHILSFVMPTVLEKLKPVSQDDRNDLRTIQESLLGVSTVFPLAQSTVDLVESTHGEHRAGANAILWVSDPYFKHQFAQKLHLAISAKYNVGHLGRFIGWAASELQLSHSQAVIARAAESMGGNVDVDYSQQFARDLGQLVQVLQAVETPEPELSLAVSRLRQLGNNLMSNKAYPQAIQQYTEAILMAAKSHSSVSSKGSSAFGHLSQLFTNRAIAYIGLNCFPEAITDLLLALFYDCNFTPAWIQLGYCHLYMGASLLSLQCYLKGFYSYVAYDETDPQVREQVLDSAMPQFIQRIIQSVALCEKRARQQQESPVEINKVVQEVEKLCNELKERSLSEDDQLLYNYEYNTNAIIGNTSPPSTSDSLRNLAERVSNISPTILNADAQQNLLARSSMEATAIPVTTVETRATRPTTADGDTVTIGGTGLGFFGAAQTAQQLGPQSTPAPPEALAAAQVAAQAAQAALAAALAADRATQQHANQHTALGPMQGYLRQFHDNIVAANTASINANAANANTANTNTSNGTTPAVNGSAAATGIANAAPGSVDTTNVAPNVSNILRDLLPEGVADNIGNIIGTGARILLNGQEIQVGQHTGNAPIRVTTTTSTTGNGATHTSVTTSNHSQGAPANGTPSSADNGSDMSQDDLD